MLYMPNGKAIERLQASFISEEEVKKIVRTISGD
jgi:DNA segregation ATPase FtsK/SpoIIIE-like protein